MERWFAVIMAGGRSERFWPLSLRTPKPFMKLFGGKSLLRLTFERVKRLLPASRILVVITEALLDMTKAELSELAPENIIVEPEGRDTAPCIGFSGLIVRMRQEDAVIACLPADHFVSEEEVFVEKLASAFRLAEETGRIVTIGLKPERPETAYGYMQVGKLFDASSQAYEVERFVEKPPHEMAKRFIEEKCYFWNSGIFVFRVDVFMKQLWEYMPDLASALDLMKGAIMRGESETVRTLYSKLPRISIDYGLMEKTRNILMIEGGFLWDDVGSWASIFKFLGKDGDGNHKEGSVYTSDTKNCLLLARGLKVAVVGLSDVAVVASQEGVMVCALDKAQDVKPIVKVLEGDPSS